MDKVIGRFVRWHNGHFRAINGVPRDSDRFAISEKRNALMLSQGFFHEIEFDCIILDSGMIEGNSLGEYTGERLTVPYGDWKKNSAHSPIAKVVDIQKQKPTWEERIVKKLKNNKGLLILGIAFLVPFGLIALGSWKTYEIYKKSQEQ